MHFYTVKISDRQRMRTVCAKSSTDALERVVGARMIGARENTRCKNQAVFDLTVRIGPTKRGLTPIKNIYATVTLIINDDGIDDGTDRLARKLGLIVGKGKYNGQCYWVRPGSSAIITAERVLELGECL